MQNVVKIPRKFQTLAKKFSMAPSALAERILSAYAESRPKEITLRQRSKRER